MVNQMVNQKIIMRFVKTIKFELKQWRIVYFGEL
jgi:hypothetical protein